MWGAGVVEPFPQKTPHEVRAVRMRRTVPPVRQMVAQFLAGMHQCLSRRHTMRALCDTITRSLRGDWAIRFLQLMCIFLFL